MNMQEIAADIVKTTRDYVAREIGPVEVRMSELEAALATKAADADVLVRLAQAIERRFGADA
jgi:hypothetical protein